MTYVEAGASRAEREEIAVERLDLRLVMRAEDSESEDLVALALRLPELIAGELGVSLPPLRVDAERHGEQVEIRIARHALGGASRPALTPRQLEVLRLLDRGLMTKQVATELGISQFTVNNHIRAILTALGASSRTSAIYRARREHLI